MKKQDSAAALSDEEEEEEIDEQVYGKDLHLSENSDDDAEYIEALLMAFGTLAMSYFSFQPYCRGRVCKTKQHRKVAQNSDNGR